MFSVSLYVVTATFGRIAREGAEVSLLQLRGTTTCRPPGVFVVGASRSGTSVTTSLLERVGLKLGKAGERQGGSAHPDGINEWNDVVRLNGKAWPGKWSDIPRPLSAEVLSSGLVQDAAAILEKLVQDTDCQPWALKDPRFVVTLPLWARAASDAGLSFAVLLVSREPISNAESLFRHQAKHTPFIDPLLRWQRMNELALQESTPYTRHLIHYSDLVSDTRRDKALSSLVAWLSGAGIPAALPTHGVGELIVSHDEPVSEVDQSTPCGDRSNPQTCVLTAGQAALAERLRSGAGLDPALALVNAATDKPLMAELGAAFSRQRQGCGIILNAYGKEKYIDRAVQTAKYLHDLEPTQGWCPDEKEEVKAKITIFTDVLPLPEVDGDGTRFVYLPDEAGKLAAKTFAVPHSAPSFHASPTVWWKRIVGLLRSPYMRTLTLDLDCLPRTGAAVADAFAQLRDNDLFTAKAPVPYGGSFGVSSAPAPPGLTESQAAAWKAFPERNLGLVGWNFHSESARTLVLDYADAFARELGRGAAVNGDQTAFREALFQHRASASGLREVQCAEGTCCRWRADDTCTWVHGRRLAKVLLKGDSF